jgi:hypothetical protein
MDPNTIIAELDAYCAKVGMKQSTVCQNALGNARLYERMKRRIDQYAADAQKLRAYMAANPPSVAVDSAPTPDEDAA